MAHAVSEIDGNSFIMMNIFHTRNEQILWAVKRTFSAFEHLQGVNRNFIPYSTAIFEPPLEPPLEGTLRKTRVIKAHLSILAASKKKAKNPRKLASQANFRGFHFGATDPIRTDDLLITSELLYRLSHSSMTLHSCNVMYFIINGGNCQGFFSTCTRIARRSLKRKLHLAAQVEHPCRSAADGQQQKQGLGKLPHEPPCAGGVKRLPEGTALDLPADLQR